MYIFWDTETSGVDGKKSKHSRFGQIFQIAMAFVGESLDYSSASAKSWRARRAPWVVPDPGAMLVTGLMPSDLKKEKMSHYEMMRDVDKYLRSKAWPVTFFAYNMQYDRVFLQNNLHQTLHDPFITNDRKKGQGEPNGNFDVMNLVIAVATYRPDKIRLDRKTPNGNPTLKLFDVAEQNDVDLSGISAHDAEPDVQATMGLAKVLRRRAPDLWKQLMSLTTKKGIEDFLKNNETFSHTEYSYGKFKTRMFTDVVSNPEYTTEHVLFDLSHDPEKYLDMSVDELADVMKKSGQKDWGPFKLFRANVQPVVRPMDDTPDRLIPNKVTREEMEDRADAVNTPAFKKKLAEAAAKAFPAPDTPSSNPEEQIFEFADPSVKSDLNKWMKEFQDGDWDKRWELTADFPERFADAIEQQPELKRYQTFAKRILFDNVPEKFAPSVRKTYARGLHKRITGDGNRVPWMTVDDAREQCDAIAKQIANKDPRWGKTDEDFAERKRELSIIRRFLTEISREPDYDAMTSNDNDTNNDRRQGRKPGALSPSP